ncbi:diacylglycerol acyltransferase [Polychytrium aggregatum]|uniref:diacylglycerol acyltransferase n=1 Tax=Polychytrium aggregatum TaxID=110093 RepID=UPI0022FDBC7A|nr:diacylglycerol acyltransferase [Polychytrium aggregatum]KAI9208221.1 diacylglycerol acyltransferase [Polychytrium aggregatum]
MSDAADKVPGSANHEKAQPVSGWDNLYQHLAVLLWCTTMEIDLIIHIVFFYFIRWLWPFAVIYWTWAFLIDSETPYRGGTDALRFIRDWSFWRHFKAYFDAELIKTCDLDPSQNYIFGYHPHGIYCFGIWPSFLTDLNNFSGLFPGIRLRGTTLDMNWRIPLWRELHMSYGLISVSARSIKYALTRMGPGSSVMIVIGGADEALQAYPGTNDLVLDKRKGFAKIAIQTGAHLVPTFTFGENDLFYQVTAESNPKLRGYQNQFMKALGFSLPIVTNRPFFFFPNRRKLVSVVGAPIEVEKQENPSREYIAQVHGKYLEGLQRLYDEFKDQFAADRTRDLRIVA